MGFSGVITFDGVDHGVADFIENVIGSDYNDEFVTPIFWSSRTFHGGKGDDTLTVSREVDSSQISLYGDAGDDSLFGGWKGFTDLYGGSGDDVMFGVTGSNMTGAQGNDIFRLATDAGRNTLNGEGSVIHDFKHGQDVIQLITSNPDSSLTNDGDSWTVHLGGGGGITFQVDGVTEMEEGVDYFFDVLV